MAGQDQSARLQGLLTGIAGSVGELGEGGQWTSNAIRNVARPDFMAGSDKVLGKYGKPEFDMTNVDNLNAMAGWAGRNGKQDEANRYAALALEENKRVRKEEKEQLALKGTETAMYHRRRIAAIQADPALDTPTKIKMIQEAMDEQQATAKATGIDGSRYDSGTAALTTLGKQQSDLAYNTKVNNIQTVIAEAERKTDTANEQDRPAFESSLDQLYERLNAVSAEKGTRLGDTMKDARRTRGREDAADLRAAEVGERANRAETRAQITHKYSIAALESERSEIAALAYGQKRASELIANKQYALTDEDRQIMPPKAIFEAEGLLETARKNAAAIEEASTKGTVQPSLLEQARVLAESDKSIAIMLKNYETTKEQSVHGDASIGAAKLLTEAVIERNKATSADGRDLRMRGAVAARMQALLDEGSFSQFLDGYDDYAEVMRDEEDFTQMRNAVSTLAKEQNLTPDQLTPDKLFELMDTAAPSLESKSWREANDRLSRMRRKALVGWKRQLAFDGKTYRENVVAEYSGKTQWSDPELDKIAGKHYETAINFYNQLLMMPITEQKLFLSRQLWGNDKSIFKPREIGNSGSYMPPLMEEEEVKKMFESVLSGEKITINSFIAE